MVENVFIWGSKSYALLISCFLKNSKKELNYSYIKPSNKRFKIDFIFDPYAKKQNHEFEGKFFNNPSNFSKNIKKSKSFVVCVGDNYGKARYFISVFLEKFNLNPLTLISKHSLILNKTKIGKGVVVMPRAYLSNYSEIGDYSILNSSSNIEHECKIGNGVHIMSGACIGGRSVVGDFATIGTNATVLPGLKIGKGAYIGAGAVVTKNVSDNSLIIGIPGKFKKKINNKVDYKIFNRILKKKYYDKKNFNSNSCF